jgi:Na+/phosphate symporter
MPQPTPPTPNPADQRAHTVLTQAGESVAAPTTTIEENRHTLGQRRVNLIWETTQALIAVAVTLATLYVASVLALKDLGATAAFLLLSNAFFLVIGFYFGRTNHQRIGGVELGR